jgi:molybdate transport system ATP-binding protein
MGKEPGPRPAALVELRGAGVTRAGAALLSDVDFRLEPGQRWALLGVNGAGKTTFLRLLRGEIAPDERLGDAGGLRVFDLPGAGGPQPTPLGLRQRLALVSGDMQDAFAAHGWTATGLDVVLSGFGDGPLLYAVPEPGQVAAAARLLDELGLSGLSGRPLARLSSGEGRRLLLARALVSGPDVLLLDECLEGLDAPARKDFLALLDRVAQAGPRLALLFATHRLDELPGCLTHALVLGAGRILQRGTLGEVLPTLHGNDAAADSAPLALAHCVVAPGANGGAADAGPGFLARLSNASVDVGGLRLLHGISWTIRPGEHWAVLGPNGAGKSTLLAVLAGQIWPSAVDGPPGLVGYGFAATGETVDETRRRIGLVSAALQAMFPYDLRVRVAVASGLDGSLDVFAEPDAAGRARVAQWLDYFELSGLAARRIRSLSRGQLRRVLLARALAGDPALLLLDEPMAGLDQRARAAARELFDRLADLGLPLVMVTHHEADLPGRFVSGSGRVLALRSGRVVFCGDWAAYAEWKAARRAGRASSKI